MGYPEKRLIYHAMTVSVGFWAYHIKDTEALLLLIVYAIIFKPSKDE